MNLEQQLSKVRLFQTEVSMLRTRILDFANAVDESRASFLRHSAEDLWQVQQKLISNAQWLNILRERGEE